MTEGMPPARPRIELTDGLVRLRAHTSADIDRIVEQSNDPESMQWTTVPRPYGPDEAREFLAHIEAGWADPKGHRYWAIEEVAAPGVYLGTIDLRPRGLSAEVGFGLHPQGRGRGVMSGALRLVCRYWFR